MPKAPENLFKASASILVTVSLEKHGMLTNIRLSVPSFLLFIFFNKFFIADFVSVSHDQDLSTTYFFTIEKCINTENIFLNIIL